MSVKSEITLSEAGELFDRYLCEYQEDMVKIVGKHRRNYHQLSLEEIISEANLLLVKGKDKFIKTLGPDLLDQNNFKRMAYAYVKNAISWSNHRAINSKDGKMKSKILDSTHNLNDESVTTFELAVKTIGDDTELEIFSNKDALKNFIHVLTKYYYLLTDGETRILSYMQKGLNQYEISEEMGVTRQAVSYAIIGLKEKVQSQFDFNDIYNENCLNGQSALESSLIR